MRFHDPFTVFPRKHPSGRVVYYYQTYDENNKRTVPRSTGKATKPAARVYCFDLYKKDKLIPHDKSKIPPSPRRC